MPTDELQVARAIPLERTQQILAERMYPETCFDP